MKTYILIIMMGNTFVDSFETTDCNADIRTKSIEYPDHDLYCVAPSYAMRPIARGE